MRRTVSVASERAKNVSSSALQAVRQKERWGQITQHVAQRVKNIGVRYFAACR